MSDVIYRVKIVSDSMSNSDWVSIMSLIISLVSLAIVVHTHVQSMREKRLNLTISLKNRQYEIHKEMAFLYFTFSNNSSRSINIDDLYLTDGRPTDHFTETEGWLHEGGSCVFEPVTFDSKTLDGVNNTTMAIPVTIPPHSSVAGYVAFYAGKSDSQIISKKLSLYLQIFIAGQKLGFELSTAANMSNYSYKLTEDKGETIFRQPEYRT